MLLHGLKEMHDQRIHKPAHKAHWPDPERLERRWRVFREVG
jgi:hypothetical protein